MIQLEQRNCKNCTRTFKTLPQSQQGYCGRTCEDESGSRAPGDRRKAWNADAKPSVYAKESSMQKTRKNSMRKEWQEPKRIENTSVNSVAKTITETTREEPTQLVRAEIAEIQPESSGEQSNSLRLASLDMMSLSKSSAEHLLKVMKATVSEIDLKRKDDGIQNLNVCNIDMVVRCANAISSILQVNVNLLKAMKE